MARFNKAIRLQVLGKRMTSVQKISLKAVNYQLRRQHCFAINCVVQSWRKKTNSFSLCISFVTSNSLLLTRNTVIRRKFVKRDSNPLKDPFHAHCDKGNLGDLTERNHIRDPGDKSSVETELIKLLEFDLTVADFNLPLL